LDISSSRKITDVSPLKNNLYLFLTGCEKLLTLNFHGTEYIRISAGLNCRNVNVSGKIRKLLLFGNYPRINGRENIQQLHVETD
jgi:hypothetical protein